MSNIFSKLRDFVGLNEQVEYEYYEEEAENAESVSLGSRPWLFSAKYYSQEEGLQYPNYYEDLGIGRNDLVTEPIVASAETQKLIEIGLSSYSSDEKDAKIKEIRAAARVLEDDDLRKEYNKTYDLYIAPYTTTTTNPVTVQENTSVSLLETSQPTTQVPSSVMPRHWRSNPLPQPQQTQNNDKELQPRPLSRWTPLLLMAGGVAILLGTLLGINFPIPEAWRPKPQVAPTNDSTNDSIDTSNQVQTTQSPVNLNQEQQSTVSDNTADVPQPVAASSGTELGWSSNASIVGDNPATLLTNFNPSHAQATEAVNFFSGEDGARLKAAMDLGGLNAGHSNFQKTGLEADAYVKLANKAFDMKFRDFDHAADYVSRTADGLYTRLDNAMQLDGQPKFLNGSNYAKALDLAGARNNEVATRLQGVYANASKVSAVPTDRIGSRVVTGGQDIQVASADGLEDLGIRFAPPPSNPLEDIIKGTGNAVHKFAETAGTVMQHPAAQVSMKGLAVFGAVVSAFKAAEALKENNYTLAAMNAAGSLAATASVASAACTALLPVTAGLSAVRIGMYAMDRSQEKTQARIAAQIAKIEENKTALASKTDRTLFENAQLAASSVQSVVKHADMGIAKGLNYAASTDVLEAANDLGNKGDAIRKATIQVVTDSVQKITPQVQQAWTRMAGMMFQQQGKQV
jgi:hypothetical protein